jgi:hypothetical protein
MMAVGKALDVIQLWLTRLPRRLWSLIRLQEYRYWRCKYRCARSEDREAGKKVFYGPVFRSDD